MLVNQTDISLSVAVWLATQNYDLDPDPNTISATSLLKPIRSTVLGRRYKDKVDIEIHGLIASQIGTAVHDSIERAWTSLDLIKVLEELKIPEKVRNRISVNPTKVTPNMLPIYLERRSSKKIDGFTISGKFDFVVDGQLEDFKTTSVFTYINQSNVDDYILQGSIYRWLNPDIITKETIKIQYIFTDWSQMKAKIEKNYPPTKTIDKEYRLMSIPETEAYILGRVKLYKQYKDAPQEQLPLCSKDDLWEKPTVYKYFKNPDAARATKNFTTYWEADNRLKEDGSVGVIKTFPGEIVRCKYCPAMSFCNQAATFIQEGRIHV